MSDALKTTNEQNNSYMNIQNTAMTEDTQKDKFMTFKCGNEFYGIGISYVEEITGIQQITEVPETDDFIKGLINLRGKIIPVIDVRLRFHKEPLPYNDRTCIIVVSINNTMIGLIVDTIAEVVTISDDNIISPPSTSSDPYNAAKRYIYGIGKVGKEVKLLIDLDKLVYDNVETDELYY